MISSKGKISLKAIEDCEYQKILLEQEGIKFTDGFTLNLKEYLWKVNSIEDL